MAGALDPIARYSFKYVFSFTDDFFGCFFKYFLKQKSYYASSTKNVLADIDPYAKAKSLCFDNDVYVLKMEDCICQKNVKNFFLKIVSSLKWPYLTPLTKMVLLKRTGALYFIWVAVTIRSSVTKLLMDMCCHASSLYSKMLLFSVHW